MKRYWGENGWMMRAYLDGDDGNDMQKKGRQR